MNLAVGLYEQRCTRDVKPVLFAIKGELDSAEFGE